MRLGRVRGSGARGCECARPSFLPGLPAPEIHFAAKARKWLRAEHWVVVRAAHWRLRCGLPSRQGRGWQAATAWQRERLLRKARVLLYDRLPGHRCAAAALAQVVSAV